MDPVVQTRRGAIRGLEADGVVRFMGIPYAKPPVGDLRFRPPQPVTGWDGTRDGTAPGLVATQIQSEAMRALTGLPPEPDGEDCLFLNVITPGLDRADRPVMVWVHGGGFTQGSGSSPMYDPTQLARVGDVVVVTLNYRLGILGFVSHPSFADSESEDCGNFGLLDQIEALRWVQEEIGAFGGDPENVTVFGESAGAFCIGALLAAPRASGLFKRAILQSGACDHFEPIDAPGVGWPRLVSVLGDAPHDPATLRRLPLERLREALSQILGTAMVTVAKTHFLVDAFPLGLVIDGSVLLDSPIERVRAGLAPQIPLMITTMSEEAALFGPLYPGYTGVEKDDVLATISRAMGLNSPEQASGIFDEYAAEAHANGDEPTAAQVHQMFETDYVFRIPAQRLADSWSRQTAETYVGVFDWKLGASGSCHALDLPFVFGEQTIRTLEPLVGDREQAAALSVSVQEAWTSFARTGRPAATNLPEWKPYSSDGGHTMVLGAESSLTSSYRAGVANVWEGVPFVTATREAG